MSDILHPQEVKARAPGAGAVFIYTLTLSAVVVALYAQSVDYPFQFDDRGSVRDDERIRDIRDIAGIWRINPPRFLVFLSFAANYTIGGQDVLGYHIFNILLHAATSAAVWYFLSLLLEFTARLEGRSVDLGLERMCAFAAALIFAVHPLQTEVVTYIWQRSSSMAALFYILTLAFYLRSCMERMDGRSARVWKKWMALSAASMILAMFSKQFAVTIPVAVALLDFILISRSWSMFRERAASWAVFAPGLLIIPLVTFFSDTREINDLIQREGNLLSWHQYFITQFNVIVFVYIKLLFYPAGQNLAHDFPPSGAFMDSAPGFIILSALLAAGLAAHAAPGNRPLLSGTGTRAGSQVVNS